LKQQWLLLQWLGQQAEQQAQQTAFDQQMHLEGMKQDGQAKAAQDKAMSDVTSKVIDQELGASATGAPELTPMAKNMEKKRRKITFEEDENGKVIGATME